MRNTRLVRLRSAKNSNEELWRRVKYSFKTHLRIKNNEALSCWKWQIWVESMAQKVIPEPELFLLIFHDVSNDDVNKDK